MHGGLQELMVKTQENVFGDTLDEKDPYFWASKLHFYITGVTFYNFPYTFGFLLSRAIFKKFAEQGSDFLEQYEYFLKISGSYDCEEVVFKSLGEDITSKDFWAGSIKTLNGVTIEGHTAQTTQTSEVLKGDSLVSHRHFTGVKRWHQVRRQLRLR